MVTRHIQGGNGVNYLIILSLDTDWIVTLPIRHDVTVYLAVNDTQFKTSVFRHFKFFPHFA